jgi:C4-dicarboxylate-specific signal transduction histidine kinase
MSAVRLGGGMAGAVVLHLDVSERKRAEQQIRRSCDSAAQTARLNALGVLAASLVHELTQPLGAAGFFSAAASSLLEGGEVEGDKLRQVLAGMDAQIQRAAQILERLRSFLRRHDPRLEPVAIRDVLAAASGLVRWLADDKGVRLRVAQPDPSLVVEGHAMQLQQVLVNLISNAIQAIDQAGVATREVTVDVAVRPTEVEIAVGDTGSGLGIDTEARLFDLLSSTREDGLRLGLAISRDVVEAHGGKLWADPDSSAGAIFRFTLTLGEVR